MIINPSRLINFLSQRNTFTSFACLVGISIFFNVYKKFGGLNNEEY